MKKALLILLLWHSAAWATTVRLETTLGNIDILMFENEAPGHVANFLNYVNDGDYDESIIHRSVPGFVIQGGGHYFNAQTGSLSNVPTDPAITNEPGVSNTRGTIAMAKVNNQPHSATSQFFFNLADNSNNLDNQNGGFTVFGEVVSGMDVVDLIASLQQFNFAYPVLNYVQNSNIQASNLIYVNKAFVLSETLSLNAALSGGWFNPATPGQGIYLEILPETGKMVMAWFAYDTELPQDQLDVILGDAGHRWFVADDFFDGNVFEGSIFLAQNGIFDANDAVSVTAVGTVRVEFESCSSALVTYEFTGTDISGSFPMSRLSTDNVALCETLSSMADPGVTP